MQRIAIASSLAVASTVFPKPALCGGAQPANAKQAYVATRSEPPGGMVVSQQGTAPGLVLMWPIHPDPNAVSGQALDLGQAYSDFDAGAPNEYHTGIDIWNIVEGTGVYPAAAGYITTIQLNDLTCNHGNKKNSGGICYDHGVGNTVIIAHVFGTSKLYTQYSHLNSISEGLAQACGTLDAKRFRIICTGNGVAVDVTTVIGTVGGSGYGCPTGLPRPDGCPTKGHPWPNYWPTHLHFEVKDNGYTSDSETSNDAGHWGYTPSTLLPDNDGYHDPVLYLAGASGLEPNTPLSVATTAQVELRTGPGGLNANGGVNGSGGEYRAISTIPQGAQYTPIRYAPGTITATAVCQKGWYQLSETNSNPSLDFPDPSQNYSGTQLAYIPYGWICADYTSANSQPLNPIINVSPSVGTQGITQFSISGQGFTPSGVVTYNVSSGTQITTFTSLADSAGSVTGSFVVSTNPASYTVTSVDNATGSLSNQQGLALQAPVLNPPFAQTLSATSLASSGATLNGEVNPFGAPGSVYFYYGTSATNLNNHLTAGTVVANFVTQPFSVPVSNLITNTSYYFEIVFYNAQSSTYLYGPIQTFNTPPAYSTTMWPSSISSSGAALTGLLDPEGSPGSVYFYYGASLTNLNYHPSAGTVIANYTPQPFSVPVSNLLTNTTYYYEIVFYDTANSSYSYGAVQSFMVLQPVFTESVTSITSSGATFTGTVNPQGSPGSVYFYYGTSPTNLNYHPSPGTVTANYTPQPFSVPVSNLLTNTTYYYEMVFYDTANSSYSYGAVQSFTVLQPVFTESVTSITSSGATLTGTVNPQGSPGSVYFYYGTSPTNLNYHPTAGTVTANYTPQPFSLPVSNLLTNTTYYYEIVFYNKANSSYSYGAVQSFTVLQPVFTESVTSITSSGATFTGTVNPQGSPGSVYFYYGTSPTNLNYHPSAGTVTANYTPQPFSVPVSNLFTKTTYYYEIVFYDTANSSYSYGAVQSFTVLQPVFTEAVTSITSSGATFTGTVNPQGSPG
jgi:hypothetical protein